MFLSARRSCPTGLVSCEKILRRLVYRLNYVVFGTVDVTTNNTVDVVTRPYLSHDFIDCVLACATINRCSFGCVCYQLLLDKSLLGFARIHATVTSTRIFGSTLANWVMLVLRLYRSLHCVGRVSSGQYIQCWARHTHRLQGNVS